MFGRPSNPEIPEFRNNLIYHLEDVSYRNRGNQMYRDKTVKTVEITYDRIGSVSVDKICRDGHKKNICYFGIPFEGTNFKTEEELLRNIYNCRGAFPNLQRVIYTIIDHPRTKSVQTDRYGKHYDVMDTHVKIIVKQWDEVQ